MARLVGAYETIHHREVNGWTVTLFHNLSHNGKQPPFSYSASVRENATENVLSCYGETREAVEREVLRIVGVSPLDAAALVEENAALRAENERLRAEVADERAESERLCSALEAVTGACGPACCANCDAYYVAKKALDGEKETP